MAQVSTEAIDELYKQTRENETEFFMRILEDPNYRPDTVDDIKRDIDMELRQVPRTEPSS